MRCWFVRQLLASFLEFSRGFSPMVGEYSYFTHWLLRMTRSPITILPTTGSGRYLYSGDSRRRRGRPIGTYLIGTRMSVKPQAASARKLSRNHRSTTDQPTNQFRQKLTADRSGAFLVTLYCTVRYFYDTRRNRWCFVSLQPCGLPTYPIVALRAYIPTRTMATSTYLDE